MKILSRDFTSREKMMLLFLSCILLALCYYQFVDRPIREALNTNQSMKDSIMVELTAVDAKLSSLQEKETELDSLQSGYHVSMMPSYNNEKKTIALLHKLLSQSVEYSISSTDLTREGNQIRRSFDLHFIAGDIVTADHILLGLYASKDRCLIEDIHYASMADSDQMDDIRKGQVSVDATATFYETMVGGVEDSGLPKDSLAVEESNE